MPFSLYICIWSGTNCADLIMSYEYTVRIPASERAMFRQLAKKMGWGYSPVRKKTGIEQAFSDIAAGRVYTAENADELISRALL